MARTPRLTSAVLDAVVLLADGHSDKEIAERLGVTPVAVAKRIHHAARVLGAPNRTGLVVEAMRRGVRDFILKPWENSRLLDVLRDQLEFGHMLREEQRLKAEADARARARDRQIDEAGPDAVPADPAEVRA